MTKLWDALETGISCSTLSAVIWLLVRIQRKSVSGNLSLHSDPL